MTGPNDVGPRVQRVQVRPHDCEEPLVVGASSGSKSMVFHPRLLCLDQITDLHGLLRPGRSLTKEITIGGELDFVADFKKLPPAASRLKIRDDGAFCAWQHQI